jgi:hypothetical protein
MKYSEMKFYQHGCHQKRDAKLWFRMGFLRSILPVIKNGNAIGNPKRRLCATHSREGTVVVRPTGCFGLYGIFNAASAQFFFKAKPFMFCSNIELASGTGY